MTDRPPLGESSGSTAPQAAGIRARTPIAAVLAVAVLLAAAAATVWPADAAGDLDPTFGKRGVVVTDFGHHRYESAYAVAIGATDKIVVAGTADTRTGQRFALARYLAGGTLDTRFGGNGRVETSFGSAFQAARDVAIQADGKVVVAGWANIGGTTDFALARYRSDGSLDPTFGRKGRVTTSFGKNSTDQAEAIALQPDGRIVVAGWTLSPSATPSDVALARYRSNGALDPSFGGDGRVTTDFGGAQDRAAALALQSDGGIVVAGSSAAADASSFALARYTPSGALDPSFGGDGRATTDFTAGPAEALGIAMAAGSIVAVGSVFTGPQIRDHSFALARYTSAGTLNGSFGSGGTVTTDLGTSGGDNIATAVAVASGKLLIVGDTSVLTTDYDHSFALARYTSAGVLDGSFGAGGYVTTDLGSGWDVARDLALDAQGRIAVAGAAEARRGGDFALARYLDP